MKFILFQISFLFISLSSPGQYSPTDTMSYYSEYFKGKRQIKISLPSNYSVYPNRKYRVIYMFDAQSTALYDFAKATLSFLPGYASFYFDPVILIGIETKNRHFEFLPRHINTDPGPKNYLQAGGADSLALSIEKELKPLIAKKYRTNGFDIAIGHSLGATFITYAMAKYPKIFNAGICISPNYTFDSEAIFQTINSAIKNKSLAGRFMYIAYGKKDEMEENFRKSTIKFGNLLKSIRQPQFDFKIDSLDNTSHSTTPLEGIFKGLVFVNNYMNLPYEKYKPFLIDSTAKYLVTYLKKYFNAQTSRTDLLLPRIGEINLIAYNAFYSGRKKEAIEILEWGISLFPDDANLFDSLGEIQQDSGNIEKAKFYYEKGLSIIESQKKELPNDIYSSQVKWFNKRLSNISKSD